MHNEIKDVLKEFKSSIEKLYKDKLKNIILFGSWARGNATKDSDIDIAVVIKGNIYPGKEIDRMIDIITEINMNYNQLISIYPVSEEVYAKTKSPLLINIKKDGINV